MLRKQKSTNLKKRIEKSDSTSQFSHSDSAKEKEYLTDSSESTSSHKGNEMFFGEFESVGDSNENEKRLSLIAKELEHEHCDDELKGIAANFSPTFFVL